MTERDEGRRSISLEVEVPGTPQEVWEAIATGPGISAWFVPSEVDEREGGDVGLPSRVRHHRAWHGHQLVPARGEASGAPALRGVIERVGDEELLIRTSDALAGLAAFEWDGRTTTVFRAACFGPDPEALAVREAEVWGVWMHQHFPSQATAVEAHG